MMLTERRKEDKAIVLDFLPNGYHFDNRPIHLKEPIVQVLGTEHFTLLELVPKKGVFLQPYEEVYIGQDKRDKIHHVNGKIPLTKLTQTAKAEMTHVIAQIIDDNEKYFVDFFNKAQPLSTRMHTLELLPGVGKKHMWEIIEERRGEPFTSFEDMKSRVKLMPDPKKAILRRILAELDGKEKKFLFISSQENQNE